MCIFFNLSEWNLRKPKGSLDVCQFSPLKNNQQQKKKGGGGRTELTAAPSGVLKTTTWWFLVLSLQLQQEMNKMQLHHSSAIRVEHELSGLKYRWQEAQGANHTRAAAKTATSQRFMY